MGTVIKQVLRKIDEAMDRKAFGDALALIEDHAITIFSSHDIKPVMCLVQKIPDEYYFTSQQKLIKGWLAFLCGENLLLGQVLSEVTESTLKTAIESSLFYSLKAITTFMNSQIDGLKYAKLSVDVLTIDCDSFYLANAKLTYGQLLSSVGEHKKAAHEFYTAYHLFKQSKSYFPAVVSLVNYGLKKHAMGEVLDVIEVFRSELKAYSSPEQNRIFELLKLPLGIALFELNKQSIAIDCLENVKTLLYSMDYVHMFGVLEMHLVYAYAIARRFDKAYALIDELSARLVKLHYDQILNLCAAMRVHLSLLEGKPLSRVDCELLEVDHMMNGAETSSSILLTLARLKLSGNLENFDMDNLLACQKSLESIGNVPNSQSADILVSEYFYHKGDMASSKEYLLKAVAIYDTHRLSARFLIEKADCLSLLKDINKDLFNLIDKKTEQGSTLLTQRELEILGLIAQGYSNEQISKQLYIGIGTTKWHINNIFSKLEVKRRSQAIAQARKAGLL